MTASPEFDLSEAGGAQLPALATLARLGWEVMPAAEAEAQRHGRLSGTLLEEVLRERLHALNTVHQRGRDHPVTDAAVAEAIGRLKALAADMTSGTMTAAERATDALLLGVAVPMTVEGETRERTLRFVDWDEVGNNRFHAVAEFAVERAGAHGTRRPDIVLLINGVPFAVIEVKESATSTDQGISQQIRNQGRDEVPHLFSTAQVLIAANPFEPRYATTGTPREFWAAWRERDIPEAEVRRLVNAPLPHTTEAAMRADFAPHWRRYQGMMEGPQAGYEAKGREPTALDRLLVSLLSPERLLEIARGYVLFDDGVKKIARHQQFFGIRRALERVREVGEDGRRKGGVIWHTQGSGKSLTMVMLARELARIVPDPRIVLVTDRTDLDRQIRDTFKATLGADAVRQATTGRQLLDLVEERAGIITTVIDKFRAGLKARRVVDESRDVFLLIDESHRSQTITDDESLRAQMRRVFPRGCYIGFTGTPLLKRERNTLTDFGGLIDAYRIEDAVTDGAVVPLLYEGRHVEADVADAVDRWFEREVAKLPEQRAELLKQKMARMREVRVSKPWLREVAADVADDFRKNWRGTPFKAQLVAESKAAAVQLHRFLAAEGIESVVVISQDDDREGHEAVNRDPEGLVGAFWKEVRDTWGSVATYEERVTAAFKGAGGPEILVVVNKLLTGFDAPRNRVLYLARSLKEHNLLQAIARVNRLFDTDDKEAGEAWRKEDGRVIDYVGLLGDLDDALTTYGVFEDYEEADVAQALVDMREAIGALPQAHAALLGLFNGVANVHDREAYERYLADDLIRRDFYARLRVFARALALAFASETFFDETPPELLARYKADLKRFESLRRSVTHRYADTFSDRERREYEARIRKLLDQHVSTDGVAQIVAPVDIFDEAAFGRAVEEDGVASTAAKADAIAHATAKEINVRLDEDRSLYESFAALVRQAIEDFRKGRIEASDYLRRVAEVREKVVHRKAEDDVPPALRGDPFGSALWRGIRPLVEPMADGAAADVAAESAQAVQRIVAGHRRVGWQDDPDVEKAIRNDIDDFLYDEVRGSMGVTALDPLTMDEIARHALELARRHVPT